MYGVYLIAEDEKDQQHEYIYGTIKEYLVKENHINHDREWKFIKATVYGVELPNIPNGNIGVNYFRDISDFKIFCRRKHERKELNIQVPNEILQKFLIDKHSHTKSLIYQFIENGAKNVDEFFNNGGGGLCEYRPGYISGYNFFNSKGVEIEWINQDADECRGIVTRSAIYKEICSLIEQGIYLDMKEEVEPKIVFKEDKKQLSGQLNILDWLGGNHGEKSSNSKCN